MADNMLFRDGYKYQLAAPELFETSFRPDEQIRVARITIDPNGVMIVADGYAWDGASGVVDRKTNLRASCGHDALYQLMRMGKLPYSEWQKADDDYCHWLKSSGAWNVTISLDRWGLQKMKGKYAHPKHRKKILSV